MEEITPRSPQEDRDRRLRKVWEVFVPHPTSIWHSLIWSGSGIVGEVHTLDTIEIYFEGGEAVNMTNYADRVDHAAGRLATRYPTIARAVVRPAEIIPVGRFDPSTGSIVPENPLALKRWIGVEALTEEHLLTHHGFGKRARDLGTLWARARKSNPAMALWYEKEAERMGIPLRAVGPKD